MGKLHNTGTVGQRLRGELVSASQYMQESKGTLECNHNKNEYYYYNVIYYNTIQASDPEVIALIFTVTQDPIYHLFGTYTCIEDFNPLHAT